MDDLERAFNAFSIFGKGSASRAVDGMDNASFVKMATECGLIDRKLKKTDVDLIFMKFKPRGSRKIDFETFNRMVLPELGAKKYPRLDPEEATHLIAEAIAASGGPQANQVTGTATGSGIYAKLTDTSQYTGQYRHRDYGASSDASATAGPRRAAARAPTGESKSSHHAGRSAGGRSSGSRSRSPAGAPRSAERGEEAKGEPGPTSDAKLRSVFNHFAAFGLTKVQQERSGVQMDSARFAKLAREAGLLDRRITSTTVDLAFTKCKPKTARRIGFEDFKRALLMLAVQKYDDESPEAAGHRLLAKVVAVGGPTAEGTRVTEDSVLSRLTDTRHYTGAHKSRFDESGHGRGLAGRDSVAKGHGTPGSMFG